MNGAAVADYRHVVGEDDFADDRDGATDENADVACPKNFEASNTAERERRQDVLFNLEVKVPAGHLRCYRRADRRTLGRNGQPMISSAGPVSSSTPKCFAASLSMTRKNNCGGVRLQYMPYV